MTILSANGAFSRDTIIAQYAMLGQICEIGAMTRPPHPLELLNLLMTLLQWCITSAWIGGVRDLC